MTEGHSFLTEQQIAQELEQDSTLLKFIMNRFSDRLPADIHENRKVYDRKLLPLFIFINEKLNNGMTPAEIDTAIDGRFNRNSNSAAAQSTFSAENRYLEEFFRQFSQDREKLAAAREKRTEVEERKAAAMEKRAEAEKQKADAMNHIARALQEMKDQARGGEKQAELAEKTAAAVTSFEEAQEPDDLLSLIGEIPEESENRREAPEEQQPELDDLSTLVWDLETEETEESTLDEDDVNDLAKLLDDEPPRTEAAEKAELDDLSMLIDRSGETAFETDDLSLLLEDGDTESREMELDDLSLLVQNDAETGEPSGRSSNEVETDDLSELIDNEDETGKEKDRLDDLSLLVEEEKPSPLTPDISPDEDFEAYKQAIINIIIELKQQGLTPEDTCDRFNKEEVRTLSGKPRWSVKTISGIYRFIDSAA